MAENLFRFFISDKSSPVCDADRSWKDLLPGDKDNTGRGSSATVGDYFSAAETFLMQDDYSVVRRSVASASGTAVGADSLMNIDIILVKHGHFYHPSQVVVSYTGGSNLFVLNMAVSASGIACMAREYPALDMLNQKVAGLPDVYAFGEVHGSDGKPYAMFLAEWFDGFHEFHVSFDQGEKRVIVWDYENGFYYLAEDEAFSLYKKAAAILTSCYNPSTFEQIQPWHHAAGDFVVKNENGKIDVRLITVRQYTSLFENSFDDRDSILEALLIFLVGLSIRMRLDREDGVKESVWNDDLVLKATVEGFYEALGQMVSPPGFEEGIAQAFREYVKQLTPGDVVEPALMVVGAYHPESSDYALVQENFQDHLTAFYEAVALT